MTVEYAEGIIASSADCVIQTETQEQSNRTPCLLHLDMSCWLYKYYLWY
jgi:hypothetical protein